ncbi:MAG: SLC13 family permease [Bacteroidales bacterium]|jgi:di/tricarboxylate transporter|nr:SLC13 family permease [Bacteroidales bacterium]
MDLFLVFVVLVFILVVLYNEWLGAAFTFMIGVTALGVFGILTPKEILSGFANEQIAVIILLLLMGEIIRQTGMIEVIFDRIFRNARGYRGFMSRMIILVSAFSAFLNNTPLVAVMMPYVNTWCKKNHISPSKLLIPLSFAAILGGTATLIGTSTNLIVNGLVVDQKIIPDLPELNLFDFAWVGIPMIVIGFAFLLLFGDKLLSAKADPMTEFKMNRRQYILEAEVRQNSNLIGKTIEQSGIANIDGLYIIEVIRNGITLPSVGSDFVLAEKDIIFFAGQTDTIADLVKSDSGLTLPTVGMLNKKKHTEVVEIVISHNSTLINKTVRESNFRGKFDSAVIAIHRNGARITGKIETMKLKAGDVLLLFTGVNFDSISSDSRDFYFISKVKDFHKIEWYKLVTIFGGTFLAIFLSAINVFPLFTGLIILILILLAMGVTNPKDLPKKIDYDLALIIVMALALGTAMMKSGAARLLSDFIITVFLPLGKIGLLSGIYFITAILAAYITNKAAVAIIFPIAVTMARDMGLNPLPFVLVVAFAAAANFMTPIGYQTNLMVYGPGHYTFKDFFKIGFPLTIIYMIVTVSILSLMYF